MSNVEDASTLIPKRSQLIKSTAEWSTIETVSLAVSVATEFQTQVYVERRGERYRWTLIHGGGPYPLLRMTAKYLQVDCHSIIIGYREVGDGWWGLNGNETDSSEPEAWAILDFEGQPQPPMWARLSVSNSIADLRIVVATTCPGIRRDLASRPRYQLSCRHWSNQLTRRRTIAVRQKLLDNEIDVHVLFAGMWTQPLRL